MSRAAKGESTASAEALTGAEIARRPRAMVIIVVNEGIFVDLIICWLGVEGKS